MVADPSLNQPEASSPSVQAANFTPTGRTLVTNVNKFSGKTGGDVNGILPQVQEIAIVDYGILLLSCSRSLSESMAG